MIRQQIKVNLLSAPAKIIGSPWTLPVSLVIGLVLGQQVLAGVVSIYLFWFFFGRAPQIINQLRLEQGKEATHLSHVRSPFMVFYFMHRAAPWVVIGVTVLVLVIIIGHRLGG